MSASRSVPKNTEVLLGPNGLEPVSTQGVLHPAWRCFLRFCGELQHREIERLKIQDGLPVLAEVTRKKVKFTP